MTKSKANPNHVETTMERIQFGEFVHGSFRDHYLESFVRNKHTGLGELTARIFFAVWKLLTYVL